MLSTREKMTLTELRVKNDVYLMCADLQKRDQLKPYCAKKEMKIRSWENDNVIYHAKF